MRSLWNDNEATAFAGDLGQRVYTSRLLGRDKSLVLHGGGNTSVKLTERNLAGEEEDVLYVKGSGWDLETIEAAGFAPVRLAPLRKLAQLDALSDTQMVNALATQLTRAGAPAPSVETILHAILPHRFVDHTHADAVLSITNTQDGEARIRQIYGDRVVIIPYVMPGFDLARLCAQRFPAEATGNTIGMVLMSHGMFSFGATARESYERMIALVRMAEDYLTAKQAWKCPSMRLQGDAVTPPLGLASLRREVSAAAGFPLVMRVCTDQRTRAFAQREDVARVSQQGPATPDHVIRTKRIPMLGSDVAGFVGAYGEYFRRHAPAASEPKMMLDPAPRMALDPGFGLATFGRTARDADIVADLYRHTMDVIERAELLGGFKALPEKDIFDVEYWDLEQAKLRKGGKPPIFAGEVVLVTGAASGIGKACVDSFLVRGAAVIGLDINPAVENMRTDHSFCGIRTDLNDRAALHAALDAGIKAFGGIDMLVLNAGIFGGGTPIASLDDTTWRRTMAINLDANLALMRECHPFLRFAPQSGRVVVIGSKNVPAPGPGMAAYSASKAALTQLARIAALEWGAQGIRVNTLHPDAVFDTGIWTEEVIAARAAHYGISVEDYKCRNVMRTEVASRDIAELAAEMCGPLFAKTTGAQLPVDGGNERVI